MTPLRKRLLEEIERRNYTQATAHAYVAAIRRFAAHFHRSPEKLGIEQVREYQLHRLEQKIKPHSIALEISALRFLYNKVLRRRYSHDDLPMPRTHRRDLPLVLSADEVGRLIDAAPNLRYRTILMTLYSTGMRRAELCGLRPEHIDKERMMLRIPHGKGDKARDVPLSPILLDQLRAYYHSLKRRNGWMFPSRNTSRPHDPITDKTVWHACRQSAIRAGIDKPVHPHTLRHSFATHLFDNGAELPVVQRLLGHDGPIPTRSDSNLHQRYRRVWSPDRVAVVRGSSKDGRLFARPRSPQAARCVARLRAGRAIRSRQRQKSRWQRGQAS